MNIRKVGTYFIRGLLLFSPFIITIYIIIALFNIIDSFTRDLLGTNVPGIGILILIALITLLGYLSSTLFFRPIMRVTEDLLVRTPLVKIIYTSIKDLFSAFMSEKKKFNKPVLVNINKEIGLQKMGFITQQDLSLLGLEGKVAVYFPHSYNFSGNLFVVDAEQVTPLQGLSTSEVMKFIISGGVTEFTGKKL